MRCTRRLRIILQSRYFFKVVAILFIVYSILLECFYPFKSKYSVNRNELIGTVTKYEIDGNKLTLYLKSEEKILVNYYFKTEEEKKFYGSNLKLGDVYYIDGIFKEPLNNTFPNLFNYKKYLKREKIFFIVSANDIVKKKNNTSIFYFIKNKILTRIDRIDSTGYLKTFILGEKSNLNEDSIEDYQLNGISHLFSISGMHVSLLIGIIMFVLNKISYNNYYKYSIVSVFLVFYMFLTDCGASILRTTIMTIVAIINKLFNLKISKIDIMLITLIMAILIDPFIIFKVGFQFSYVISLTLNIMNKKINKYKNYFIKSLYISFICFIVSFPICIYHFYQVNIFSIFLNLIMIPLVSIIVFPFSLVVFIFPMFSSIFIVIIETLEYINELISNIDILILNLMKPNLIIVVIYYLVIIMFFINYKYMFVLFLVIIFHKFYPYLNNKFIVTMMDVGQGDSIFINYSNNKINLLIDTGGMISYSTDDWEKRKKDYSIIIYKTIPYLKSMGVNKLDYLIVTHGDYDHMGEAINLVNNFKVEKVIFNCGEFNELEQELIKVLDKKKIPYYSCIKELNIDDNKLYFLQTKEYDNENDNSNVIYTELNGYKFMFMGDASVTTEKEIMNKYNLPDIDVLKVGHHGSRTSSGKEFIDEINPKYSIISVGKNNRYGHPNKEVLKTLNNSKIYRTDQDGSIMFSIKNNKLEIETCSP